MIRDLFDELDRRGLKAEIVNGSLRIVPSERLDADLRDAVKTQMPEILAHVAAAGDIDVEWRLKAFLIQLQPIQPPAVLPFLVALDAEPKHKEDCPSCAELREPTDGFICGPCATAKRLALEMWMVRPVQVNYAA